MRIAGRIEARRKCEHISLCLASLCCLLQLVVVVVVDRECKVGVMCVRVFHCCCCNCRF